MYIRVYIVMEKGKEEEVRARTRLRISLPVHACTGRSLVVRGRIRSRGRGGEEEGGWRGSGRSKGSKANVNIDDASSREAAVGAGMRA